MNTAEYLKKCIEKENVTTWYKLSKILDITEQELYFYRRGERLPSLYAYFKISECLGIDVSIVMADIASESEKNPKKRDFFKSFMSSAGTATALSITAVFLIIGSAENALDGFDSHNVALCLNVLGFYYFLLSTKGRSLSLGRKVSF